MHADPWREQRFWNDLPMDVAPTVALCSDKAIGCYLRRSGIVGGGIARVGLGCSTISPAGSVHGCCSHSPGRAMLGEALTLPLTYPHPNSENGLQGSIDMRLASRDL